MRYLNSVVGRWTAKTTVALYICVSPLAVSAQFGGSGGDGHDDAGIRSTSLSGAPIGVVALYLGGDGDGHDGDLTTGTLSGANVAVLFGGGGRRRSRRPRR